MYLKGLNDAWKYAEKAVYYWVKNDDDHIVVYHDLFDSWAITDLFNYSASEAIDKIKEYEKKQQKYPFPENIGDLCEMYVDGRWVTGKIINGYRFADGIVTIETENGEKYWCGQDRTDSYRQPKQTDDEEVCICDTCKHDGGDIECSGCKDGSHYEPIRIIYEASVGDASTVEVCEDCISREAVIEDVIKCTDMNDDTMEVLENKVRALPSVQPRQEYSEGG